VFSCAVDDDDGTLSVGDDVLAEEELGALLISAGGVPGDEFRLDGGSGRGWSFVSSYSPGTVAIEAPVIAIVPAMASALSFLVKVMSHAPLHVMFVP